LAGSGQRAASGERPAPPGMDKVPASSTLISGALGGPFVIYLCTPLRNALTLGSQDRASGFRLLLRKVFRGGSLAGWTGGAAPAVVACPQFLALGPIYHALHGTFRSLAGVEGSGHVLLPSFFAAVGAGLCETCLTFGSQSRNAQMAYNNSFVSFSSVEDGSRIRVPLNKTYQPWGVGAGPMFARNAISAVSVRTMSPWLRESTRTAQISPSAHAVLCDVCCSVSVCTVTAPVHQLFNFMATTPQAARLPRQQRWKLAREFLNKQYFTPLPRKSALELEQFSWKISPVAARDFGMRTIYVTSVFTIYMFIERTLCAAMKS